MDRVPAPPPRFGDFRKTFVEGLERRLGDLETAMEAVRENPGDAGLIQEAVLELEKLFGTGGLLGIPQVCRTATFLRSMMPPPAPGVAAPLPPAEAAPPSPPKFLRLELPRGPAPELRRIFMAPEAGGRAADLGATLRPFGYEVVPFSGLETLARAVLDAPPLAILLDASLLQEPALARLLARGLPLFAYSREDDLEARLEAVRAGARGFYSASDDPASFVDGLDRLALASHAEPHRVLIVDDDPVAASLHAAILRRGGVVVSTVTDPSRVLDALSGANPDLLLLDMDLGPYSGDELAAAIRQHPTYVGIPIVFLSSEARPSFQFAARGSGGDDFLVKPVPPAHLLSEVALRAEHGRRLRTHLLLDGQTGTLNHPAFLRRLRAEVDLARRRGRPLCCARIDIDRFRLLNATQGFAAGDRALRRLSSLLRNRLRHTDFVGRSGADTFTAVLPDVDARAGARVVEDLLKTFSEFDFSGSSAGGGSSFSAGVAAFPDFPETALLLDAVQKAQLQAVAQGGGRVLTAL